MEVLIRCLKVSNTWERRLGEKTKHMEDIFILREEEMFGPEKK